MKEKVIDECGNILWEKPYPFRRLFAKGQEQVINSKRYITISCKLIGDTVYQTLKRL